MRLDERPAGWLGGTYGFTDDDHFIGVVRFDSRVRVPRRARRAGAGMWWAGAESLMDGACEIHQSDDVSMMLNGGSDDAGFVQIMRGRVGDETSSAT